MTSNNFNQIAEQQTISSMEIAEITGKQHKDVLKAIRNMEPAWENVTGRKFALCKRIYELANHSTREVPYYALSKRETLFVATKFQDEARAKLVIRWEQLERQQAGWPQQQGGTSDVNLPADPRHITRKQLILMALEAENENEKLRDDIQALEANNYGLRLENGQKAEQIRHLEERTAYLNVIMADTSTVTVTQIAQDYGMSAVSFNNLLKGLHIQRKVGEQWILYADFLSKGYVANRMVPIHHAGGQDTYKPMTAWTQLGRRFLYEHLKKHGLLPLIERSRPVGGDAYQVH